MQQLLLFESVNAVQEGRGASLTIVTVCHWHSSCPSYCLSSPIRAPPSGGRWTVVRLSILMPRLVAGQSAIGIRHPSAACPCLSFPGSGPLLRLAAQSPNFEFVGEAASQAREKKI